MIVDNQNFMWRGLLRFLLLERDTKVMVVPLPRRTVRVNLTPISIARSRIPTSPIDRVCWRSPPPRFRALSLTVARGAPSSSASGLQPGRIRMADDVGERFLVDAEEDRRELLLQLRIVD